MDLILFFGIVVICGLMAMVIASAILDVWPTRSLFQVWFKGYKWVQFYDGQYHFNEDFTTAVKFDDAGNIICTPYRYNSTKVGRIKMCEDGTAEYCGRYKWKII